MRYRDSTSRHEEELRAWAGALLVEGSAPRQAPVSDYQEIGTFLRHHGLEALIFGRMDRTSMPADVAAEWKAGLSRAAALELARKEEFVSVMRALSPQGQPSPIVFKGQALAYSLYPQPWLRPRVDVDLLIEKTRFDTVEKSLVGLGYERFNAIDGDLILRQAIFQKRSFHTMHAWDVHWAISNRPALAGALTYRRLLETATPRDVDGVSILVPDLVDALLIACVHLIGHHSADTRLIWLYDIHLLANALSEAQCHDFLRAAAAHAEMKSACRASLELTGLYLPTRRTRDLSRLLGSATGVRAPAVRSRFMHLLQDARAVRGSDRIAFVRQHLFPSPAYMTRRYGIKRRWQLPFWYVIRIGRALPKLFGRQ
ncbi:MAG: nucleotidyltransferase family protein [Arenicellales bacterium]